MVYEPSFWGAVISELLINIDYFAFTQYSKLHTGMLTIIPQQISEYSFFSVNCYYKISRHCHRRRKPLRWHCLTKAFWRLVDTRGRSFALPIPSNQPGYFRFLYVLNVDFGLGPIQQGQGLQTYVAQRDVCYGMNCRRGLNRRQR